jgi:hypothetical protein
MAAVAAGRFDDAARHLKGAIAASERNGWTPPATEARLRYAAMLCERSRDGDREEALLVVYEVIRTAEKLGMAGVNAEALRVRDRILGSQAASTHADPEGPVLSRRDRARARVTSRGRDLVARWAEGVSDDELVRRFGSKLSQRALFGAMARAFQPGMAFGFSGDLVIELRSSEDTGDLDASDWWTIEVRRQKARARRGRSDNPILTLCAGMAEFVRIVAGELHPVHALLEGTIDVQGDFMAAARIPDMFGAIDPELNLRPRR